jgi:hypothetical protein
MTGPLINPGKGYCVTPELIQDKQGICESESRGHRLV